MKRDGERERERESQIEVNETKGDGHINEPSASRCFT